jgi:hypothetical protein
MTVRLKNKFLTGSCGVFTGIMMSCFAFCAVGMAQTSTSVPDNQKASITIQGVGVAPNAKIFLSTGSQQKLSAQSDGNGNFTFSNLIYSSFATLKFSLDIPPNDSGLAKNTAGNHLEMMFDPRGSKARISGNIGKSGTLAFNLQGAESSLMQIAGEEGIVNLQTRTGLKLASGKSQLVASIINVGEVCCPNMVVPAPPITLTISSVPISSVPAPQKQTAPAIMPKSTPPYIQQNEGSPAAVPYSVPPVKNQESAPDAKPEKKLEKKKAPYIVQGSVQIETDIISDEISSASVTFSQQSYESTYVGGLKRIADEIRNSVLSSVSSIGSMFDARILNDTLRSLRISTVETLKNYTPSDTICRFGTLSRSLAISEATVEKNRLAFSKILFDRNRQQYNTVYSEPGQGLNYMIEDFKVKYSEGVDNNNFLDGYCTAATNTSDALYNRDVDFTRVFDVPLTFDADFTGAAKTNDQQSLIALFHNLTKIPPYMSSGEEAFDPNKNLLTTQDARAINAARDVADNSFGALVGEKAKTTSASANYMRAVLTRLGVTAPDANRLIGENPSYFAQMEILTKKIFQDPTFYANLYDSPANIDRQRVAMKAVELQQDRDFLESLRRREMLLSVLLNLKLGTDTDRAKESGTMSSN